MAQKLVRFIEIEDFKKVLAAEKDKKFKLAYVLGFGSGLRISEIVGYKGKSRKIKKGTNEIIEKDVIIEPLKKEQVDLDKHQIKLLGKGNKERITMTSPWLNKTNIELLPLDIPRRTLQGRFKRICQRTLGIPLNFHTLRHGFANHLANERNIPLPMLQQLGGWSRLDTVGIYAKSNPQKAVDTAWENF